MSERTETIEDDAASTRTAVASTRDSMASTTTAVESTLHARASTRDSIASTRYSTSSTAVASTLDGMSTTTTIVPSTFHSTKPSPSPSSSISLKSIDTATEDIHSAIALLETRLTPRLPSATSRLQDTLCNTLLPRKWALDRKEKWVRKHAEENEKLFRLKARVAVIGRLGEGVLGEIFGWCVRCARDEEWSTGEWTALRSATFNTRAAPWVLTHVSRSWRALAYRLPHLWTFLSFSKMWMGERYRRMPPASSMVLVPLIESWISRSAGMPLNVHLEGGEGEGTLFTVFAAESTGRWARLSVGAVYGSVRHLICDTHFPELKALSVDYSSPNGSFILSDVVKVDAPELTTLRLTGVDDPTRRLAVPWDQVRRVELCDTPYNDVLGTLPCVEDITISECARSKSEGIIPFERVVVSSARALYLEDWFERPEEHESGGVAENVLAQFEFPQLEVLSIGVLASPASSPATTTKTKTKVKTKTKTTGTTTTTKTTTTTTTTTTSVEEDLALQLPAGIPPSVTTLLTHSLVRTDVRRGLQRPVTPPAQKPKQVLYLRMLQGVDLRMQNKGNLRMQEKGDLRMDEEGCLFVAIEFRPPGKGKRNAESLLRTFQSRQGLLERIREIVFHDDAEVRDDAQARWDEGEEKGQCHEDNAKIQNAIQDAVGALAHVERVRMLPARSWDDLVVGAGCG
ncbi:hypothetical protein CYLTODRAFT_490220 [Cylindrobasidium torrendii FP15055 ss-10]|uniref:F-box domain-containing protein n=1 Tax=Cylindrobasidium torrendii FP15055 ss-10 TaxID=1314674 RepID=A0A0D7BE74_9AGAR|nr:hypothetical protein CYLTODRAFT_490220 [Cylindrobasidium torrendii FP15055 ss-10]